MTTPNAERLMDIYANQYMEKVFYFCLRKCGQEAEAEDLASDNTCQILTAIHKGQTPEHFSAWVWRIARNRYSRWADRKRRQNEFLSGKEPSADIPDADTLLPFDEEDETAERLSLLRRELSFVREDYRTIPVAYYLENRSVQDIADALGVPKGTVMSKLHRARKHLKEGMNMAREFGKRSYKPEEIHFVNSCSAFGKEGQPWSILNHLMYKNIFLELYDNPKTAEEMAMEMGIALPYMQSELDFLVAETFLTKEDDTKGTTYQTAFPIISRDAQCAIHNKCVSAQKDLTELCERLIDRHSAACTAHGIDLYGHGQSYACAKWTLLMLVHDYFLHDARKALGYGSFTYAERPSGGRWDIIGFQETGRKQRCLVGMHSSGEAHHPTLPPACLSQFKFYHKNIADRTPIFISHELTHTLREVACGHTDGCEQAYLDELVKIGYLRKTDAGYEPTVLILRNNDDMVCFTPEEQADIRETAERIRQTFRDLTSFIDGVTVADLPPIMRNDEHMRECARRHTGMERSYLIEQALSDGWLTECPDTALGAYMYI